MAGFEGQHAVARRQRVDQRGLPGPVPDEGYKATGLVVPHNRATPASAWRARSANSGPR